MVHVPSATAFDERPADRYVERVEEEPRQPMNLSAVGFKSAPHHLTYDWKTVVLYALGIGAKKEDLDYLYEGRGPKVYPTFAVCPVMPVVFECLAQTGGDSAMIVHGGQSLRLHRAIPPAGELVTTGTLAGLYDMKRFAQAVVETRTTLGGEPLFDTVWSIIYRNAGGFGGPRPPKNNDDVSVPKDRAPDFRVESPTTPEQALLYRLSGDLNPLHADPAFAASVGFTQAPILHGLCTYGIVARAVVNEICGGDGAKLRRIDGQFRKPVWPGDTIVTEGYRLEDGKVALTVRAKERDESVMADTWAEVAG
jgi:acyl dehydratase